MRPPESFIGQPIRSLQTMLRVLAENDENYLPIIPDGIYGPDTVQAISIFQRRHGLPVTGVTDQATWEAIVARYTPALVEQAEAEGLFISLDPGQVIRRGERHPHLYLVQAILRVLSEAWESIPAPQVSGILDDATADSLASFQNLTNLPMTGHLDKHTWKALVLHYSAAASYLLGGSSGSL